MPLPLMSAPSSDPFKAIRMSAIDPHETLTMPLSPMPEPILPDTSAFGASAPPTVESPRQQEENTLQQQHQTRMAEQSAKPEGFGHKLLHGLNVFRNIAETSLVPGVAMADPTSELHKNLVDVNRQERLGELQDRDLTERKQFNEEGLKQAQLAMAGRKQDETEEHHQQQIDQQLRTHGYKLENGEIQPLAYEEMSPQQQAVTDLKQSQQALADANEEVKRASLDPSSPQYQFALKKLQVAQQGHQAAQMRAQAALLNAYGGNFGTDTQGNPLPGAMLNDEGQPIGSHFSGNVRPTGQERNKGDMAISAREQLNDIRDIVHKHPDLFGPGYGQSTAFRQWLGSGDSDAQRFIAARTIAGDHLAGTFGGRSEAALDALDKAIGEFKTNPAAMDAGLGQLLKANDIFEKKGQVKTVGSHVAHGGPKVMKFNPATGRLE